jgi:hypothetical protein
MEEAEITDRSFRLVDFFDTEPPILTGKVFRDCSIFGPAIMALLDNVSLLSPSFEGQLDAILWEIPESREMVIGAIGLQNCVFERCRFFGIGLAGPPDLIARFRDNANEGAIDPDSAAAFGLA